ncbi:MAG: tetratricopeptide repeat protein [Nitrospiraceae bacterium]|nr:tetratricopeptide repeat protein [Nitrospiraceae bacterium]
MYNSLTGRGRSAAMLSLFVACIIFLQACSSKKIDSHLMPTSGDSRAWNDKSASFNAEGKYQEALGAAERAIVLDPALSLAWNNKAVALIGLGRTAEAIEAADRAVELQKDNALAWSNKAVALRLSGRVDEALKAVETALRLQPQNGQILYNKACYLSLLGKQAEALDLVKHAIELEPSLKSVAAGDEDLRALRDNPDFQNLIR